MLYGFTVSMRTQNFFCEGELKSKFVIFLMERLRKFSVQAVLQTKNRPEYVG